MIGASSGGHRLLRGARQLLGGWRRRRRLSRPRAGVGRGHRQAAQALHRARHPRVVYPRQSCRYVSPRPPRRVVECCLTPSPLPGTLFATGPQQTNLFNPDPSLAVWDVRALDKAALQLRVNQLEVNVASFSSCGMALLPLLLVLYCFLLFEPMDVTNYMACRRHVHPSVRPQ